MLFRNPCVCFCAFPIILNMSSANRILLNSTELSCDFLFSICLLFSLCSLLLLSSLLLCRILSSSLWLDRSANFCLMLLTFFLFCGFIIDPAIHSHNLRAKKKMKLLRIRMGISSNKIVLSFSFDFWGFWEKKVASIVVLADFPRFSISNRKIWLILRAKQKF